MKRFMKWLSRTIGSAVCIILIIVLLPYASKLAEKYLPALDGAAINTTVTLKREMQDSARLETVRINEEGIMNSTTTAMLLGEVQSVTIKYTYTASIGIDLSRVGISLNGNTLTFKLPKPEILADELHPDEISRDDFWYPLTDERRQALLDAEQDMCREYYLNEYMHSEDMWQKTIKAFESTISSWIGQNTNGLIFKYEYEQNQPGAVPLG